LRDNVIRPRKSLTNAVICDIIKVKQIYTGKDVVGGTLKKIQEDNAAKMSVFRGLRCKPAFFAVRQCCPMLYIDS